MRNKYIKLFEEVFNLSDEVNKVALEDLEKLSDDIKIYNSRKSNLKNLIMGNIETNKDISKNIDDIVKSNRFLKMYLSILNNMATLEQVKKSIEDLNNKIADKKSDINDAKSIEDQASKNKKVNELNADIAEINKTLKEKANKITELNKSILQNENELKKTLKLEQEKLVKSMQKLKK